jgi:TonB family protein
MLPSSVTLAVFYLLYKGLVRNDTHLNSRRFAILGFLAFAIVLPFLNFQIPVNIIVGDVVGAKHALPLQKYIFELPIFTVFAERNSVAVAEIGRTSFLPIFGIIGWIYAAVVLILAGRWLVGIWCLSAFSRNGKRMHTNGATIISSSKIPTAFSFFHRIFIPETSYSDDEKEMILRHEHVHVKQKHSWDLMLMEMICTIQFFNPFVWLLKREMRLNHEYLADRGALENSRDFEKYFTLLYKKILGKQPILVHSFHYSPTKIKHRIMMQLTKPAKMLSQARYLAFIPVALALTFLFACQDKKSTISEALLTEPEMSEQDLIVAQDPSGEIFEFHLVDGKPEFPGGNDALLKFIGSNITYPSKAREAGIHGTVYAQFVVECDGGVSDVKIIRDIGAGCGEEVIRVVKNMPKWTPGKKQGEAVRVIFTLPVKFTLSEDNAKKAPPPPQLKESVADNSSNEIFEFHIVDGKPEFPGGIDALLTFFGKNINYPSKAREAGIHGTVYIQFVVDIDGGISDIKIVRDIGAGCGEEAIRAIKNMPKWTPGKIKGEAVRVQYVLPVRFTLDT